jgi:cell division protein FtsX
MNGVDHEDATSDLEFTFIGTGSYMVFWPFLIGALLIGLLIAALILCSATIFNHKSLQDMVNSFRQNDSS